MSSSHALCRFPSVKKKKKTWHIFVQCIIKQILLDSVFVISRIIKVSVRVIRLGLRLQLITLKPWAWLFWISQKQLPIIVCNEIIAHIGNVNNKDNHKEMIFFLILFCSCYYVTIMLLMSGWSHFKHNIMMSLSRPLCWNVVMPFVIKSYVKASLVIRPFMKLYSRGAGGSEPPASRTLLSRFLYLYLLPPALFCAAPVWWFKIVCLSHFFAIWQLTRHMCIHATWHFMTYMT